MNTNFSTYVNRYHPSYEGTYPDGKPLIVVLLGWSDEIILGEGKITSSSKKTYSFTKRNDIISFIENDLWETRVMVFSVSEDFKSLALMDKITEQFCNVVLQQSNVVK